jgi:hypothetical protein
MKKRQLIVSKSSQRKDCRKEGLERKKIRGLLPLIIK